MVASSVAVPIVTALIGLVGGLLAADYAARQQRNAERRGSTRERALELARRLGGAADAASYAVESSSGDPKDAQKAFEDAQWLRHELAASLPAARLQLGEQSGTAAKRAVDSLALTLAALKARRLEEAHTELARASEAVDEFVREARVELEG
jgi:hypothetical protein